MLLLLQCMSQTTISKTKKLPKNTAEVKTQLFSATKFETYKKCPMRYKFKYVLEVKESFTSYLNLGNSLHSVFEKIAHMQIRNKKVDVQSALAMLGDFWDSLPYDSYTDEQNDILSAQKMIQTFLDWSKKNPHKLVDVEIPFVINIGKNTVRGKIDRLEIDSDGNYHVVDYKTGRVREDLRSIRNNSQVNIYAMAVRQLYGKLPVTASLFYLKDKKTITYPIVMRQDIQDHQNMLCEMTAKIQQGMFTPVSPSGKCRGCPYRKLCNGDLVN